MDKMKRYLALVLALCLCFALAACGGTEETQAPGTVAPESEVPESEAQETESPPEEQKEEIACETTYSNARIWTTDYGTTWVQAVAEVKNTGTSNLYLSGASYDLEDTDGNLIAAQQYVSTYPDVLAPGETGYMYDETTLDNYSGDGEVTIVTRVEYQEANIDLIRYGTSDVSVSDGQYGGITVLGRIENTSEEVTETTYVVAIFKDAEGTPIGSAMTILTTAINPGEKMGFELSTMSAPPELTAEAIAETVVYAYPMQFNF